MSYPYFNAHENPFTSTMDTTTNFDNSLNYKQQQPNNNITSKFKDNIDTRGRDILRQQLENHKLADIFYSKSNLNRLQKMIKKEVYIRTYGKYVLEVEQDENDLLVAMRAVYYLHAKFQSDKFVKQVKELNKLTIDYILPDIVTQIKQEYEYLREINRPLKPIMRPINLNSGKQTLPAFTTLFS